METAADLGTNKLIQHELQQLFDAAAAKSLAVINQDDAEPEMARFLHAVIANPEQRSFVIQLFINSFSDSFHMIREPWEMMQYCMHFLRWPEIQEFVTEKRQNDVQNRGARSSSIWKDILDAFSDNWAGARSFQKKLGEGSKAE